MSKIRLIKQSDLKTVDQIYNQAIQAKISTAHTVPLSGEERMAWFREHDPATYPVYVYDENDVVAGYIFFSPYRKGRKALKSTAEISYYVHNDFHRRGIGTSLMEHAIQKAPDLGFKTLIAILMDPNTASIALLKKFGFNLWGNMPGILEVDGEKYNHQYYGLHIS
ncbi:GNAT family N-acetyltransferase [Bacteroidota bacterium]